MPISLKARGRRFALELLSFTRHLGWKGLGSSSIGFFHVAERRFGPVVFLYFSVLLCREKRDLQEKGKGVLQVEIEVELRKVDRWISQEEKLLAQYKKQGKSSAVKLVESVLEDLRTLRSHLLQNLGQDDS